MRFHDSVRGVLDRLTAALLVGLLAGPATAPGWLSVAGHPATSSTNGNGMAATPPPALSVDPAVASLAVAASPASATQRVPVRFHPLPSRIVIAGTSRLPIPVKPAPTILRV
jgi:hypothetical protein